MTNVYRDDVPVACEVGGMPSAVTSWTCATAVMI